jgi:lysophospholipase L1-like esterase
MGRLSAHRTDAYPAEQAAFVAWHPATVRYVAVGDSYTIGTSVEAEERWPNRLVAALASGSEPVALELVANLAVNGWTSGDVLDRQLPALAAHRPELVSVLIGVNDVVRGVPPERYRSNVQRIVDDVVALVGATRLLGVTIPDYTVTPAGAGYGHPATQAARIRTANAVFTDMVRASGGTVVDIYDISLRAAGDRSLVAGDGLHPSGAQYALWVERIAPAVRTMLAR